MKKKTNYVFVLKGEREFKEKLEEANIYTEEIWMCMVKRNSKKGRAILKITND